MRIVKEFLDKELKTTVFHWNGKYLLKFEFGDLEQTYKIDEFDVIGENAIDELITDDFIADIRKQFMAMHQLFDKHTADL